MKIDDSPAEIDCIVVMAEINLFPNDDHWEPYCDVFLSEESAEHFYEYCLNSPRYRNVTMSYKNFTP